MNSTEEEKDNSKCLEKIISLFLFLFFQNWFYLREGGGMGRVHPATCRVSASASG